MSETISISQSITAKIKDLEALKTSLPSLSQQKALASSEYEKNIALTIMGLKNGKQYLIENEAIVDVPNAVLDKVAKGICWQEKMKMDVAESKYKNALEIIDLTKAQLNGYQSINRHLSEA